MKTFLIISMLLLTSCATTYEYTNGDKSLKIKTHREFPGGIEAEYGDFRVKAGDVQNGGDAEAISNLILGILPLIQPVKGG